jgi:hypothetical protein
MVDQTIYLHCIPQMVDLNDKLLVEALEYYPQMAVLEVSFASDSVAEVVLVAEAGLGWKVMAAWSEGHLRGLVEAFPESTALKAVYFHALAGASLDQVEA